MRRSIIFGGIIASALSAVLLWYSLRDETKETNLPDKPSVTYSESNSTKANRQTNGRTKLEDLVSTFPQKGEEIDAGEEPETKETGPADSKAGISEPSKIIYIDGSWERKTTNYPEDGIKENITESGYRNNVISTVVERYDQKEGYLLEKQEIEIISGEKTASITTYDKIGITGKVHEAYWANGKLRYVLLEDYAEGKKAYTKQEWYNKEGEKRRVFERHYEGKFSFWCEGFTEQDKKTCEEELSRIQQ